MIARDSEGVSQPPTDADIEAVYAARCKELSYELYTLIDNAVKQVECGTSTEISLDSTREWRSKLHELNCSVSQYARAAVSRIDRMQIETALVHNSMAADLLDREACHTHTLEAIASIELASRDEGVPSSSSSVNRAMQLVAQMHAGSAPFTCEKPNGYFGASRCLSRRNG
jgi:hypothetical protein